MDQAELNEVLAKHALWANYQPGGARANLQGANLQGADLQEANLYGANLMDANLHGADLQDASLPKFQIPQGKSILVWKKCRDNQGQEVLVKLQIPCRAKRTANLKNNKCRAEYAKVLSMHELNGKPLAAQVVHGLYNGFTYEVGKTVRADSYNGDTRLDCTNGIHFFMTQGEASAFNF